MCGVNTAVYGFKASATKFCIELRDKTCRKNIALAIKLELGQK